MNSRLICWPVFLLLLCTGCAHLNLDGSSSNSQNADAAHRSQKGQDVNLLANPAQLPGTGLSSPAENDSEPGAGLSGITDYGSVNDPNADSNTAEDSASIFENEQNHRAVNPAAVKKTEPALDEALELCQISQEFWQKGELENAVEALDQAYALILSVDTSDKPKLLQQKEDLRFMISKRILEIYASRNIVVNGNYNAIPMVINRHVQREIDLFTKGPEKRFFTESYRRSGRYRSQIVSTLKAAGLPVELSWLPLIESGFKVKALSRSRALGLWQFIPSTGYKFGLRRDKFIDERMDPEKSTQAAIEYLKELHRMFGDWATVLAAYNCGEGRVLRVIRSQNLNYLDNFWDLYERLPYETARYVPRFLATLHIVNNLEKYGLDITPVEPPVEYDTVVISKQIHLKNAARIIGVPADRLEELNPELRYQIVPGDDYPVKVPLGRGDVLLAKIDQIPVSKPPQRAFVYHRVRPGETLSVIARRYRSNVRSIMRANNLRRSNYIVAGKLLKVPQRGYVHRAPKIPKPNDGQAVTHVVRQGDSLWIIAKKYGTTTKNIQALNHLTTTALHKGQVLTIFAGKEKPPTVEGLGTYEVQAGDSPFLIAKRHNMSLERFLYLNQLWRGSKIYPGQKVYVE